jgi:ACS family hexuronate transporter-like MFS transporter
VVRYKGASRQAIRMNDVGTSTLVESASGKDETILSYETAQQSKNYRWVICGLLFFATTINYMDRQIIGVLKPTMQKELGWNEIDYSNIVFAFQIAYAGGQFFVGRMMDVFGVRIGYLVSVVAWSLASMGHGLARSVTGFATARFGLGVAEGGNFPAAIKTVSEWFPKRQRALATGIFNSGSNMGALLTPLIVPVITARWGWPAAFYLTGAIGLIWAVAWLALYRPAPRAADADAMTDLEPVHRESWLAIALRKPTIAYVLAGMLTGPVWWFYLFWVPDFLNKKYNLDLLHLGLPLAVIYLMSDVGSIGGGWLSAHFMKRGWSLNVARKTAMLVCAIAVVPVFFASVTGHLWIAVVLIGLAAAAHQGWSANLYTFVSDTTAKRSVASVIGIGGLAGGLAGMTVAKIVGYVLQFTGSYYTLFVAASSMYLIGLLILHVLVPRIEAKEPVDAA